MRLIQRIQLVLKGRINEALDRMEDPERSLHQLVHDMEERLEKTRAEAAP
jgi:phage shock protein A